MPKEVETFKPLESDDSQSLTMQPQSGMFCSTESPGKDEQHQTVEFVDQNPSFECVINSEIDNTRSNTYDANVEFGNFFERPILINTVQWQTGFVPDVVFNPWELWANNPRVSNRLNNYSLFKGKLKVKVVINGNQFYWGRALLSYLPRHNTSNFTTENTWLDKLPASQRPHIWIDPSTSQGGSMTLPFFWESDAVDLTSATEIGDLGQLWLLGINPLFHPTASDPITISFFAWMEDIELTAPTQVNAGTLSPQSGLLLQSGEETCNTSDGPISKPLSTVAKAAAVMKKIPSISPYAATAEAAATTLGKMASLFGYSRPRQIGAPQPRKIMNVGNTAATDIEDNSTTLALTAKHAVSIDPRTTGLSGADELTINHIAGKESLFASPNWTKSMAQNTILFSCPVTPQLWRIDSRLLPPSADGWAHTPMSYAVLPFTYWRATLKFRFQVVASGYHKGRLLIVHDPVTGATTPETNVVRSRIVDIAEERDFTVKVGWAQKKSYLQVRDPVLADPFSSGGTPYAASSVYHNGAITVYVLNELVSSGADTNPVTINVIVSAEDVEVGAPAESKIDEITFLPLPAQPRTLSPQAGVISSDENSAPMQNVPEDPPEIAMFGSPTAEDKLASIYMGERVASFRALIKRYCYQDTVGYATNAGPSTVFRLRHSRSPRPIFRGYTSQGINTDPVLGTPVNAVATSILAYAMAPFAGWKGNLRYKFVPCQNTIRRPGRVVLSRGSTSSGYTTDDSGVYQLTPDNLQFLGTKDCAGWAGALVTTTENSNVLEFEQPWYADSRFSQVVMSATKTGSNNGFNLNATTFFDDGQPTESPDFIGFDAWIAAGDEFNLFFFSGIPSMWTFEINPVLSPT